MTFVKGGHALKFILFNYLSYSKLDCNLQNEHHTVSKSFKVATKTIKTFMKLLLM